MLKISLLLTILAEISLAFWPPPYRYAVDWFHNVSVDHFSFDFDGKTFSLRYLVNDTYFDPKIGVIFFYTGNEGDITLFANNTGFMWDNAEFCSAMVLFAEHRYYGESMPYGKESFKRENLAHLTSEQALADFAVFLRWFKNSRDDVRPETPVIAFGGSYGGMLAAWMRAKYPHIIAGALASSAPVIQFTGLTKCETYTSIVTDVYKRSGPNCADCIKDSWPIIRLFAKSDEGRQKLNKIFHFCPDSLITDEQNASQIIDWLGDIWGSLSMINYPYETNFLNPVPAWPVKSVCSRLSCCSSSEEDSDSLLTSIYEAASVYLNYTGSTPCYAFLSSATQALGTAGWDYQACTEMVMPMCNSEDSMFEKTDWSLANFSDSCFEKYGVRPRENWAVTEYGGLKLQAASNIIFSNGNLDPWSGGGILHDVSDSVISLMVQDGAHHYDLRGKHPDDTSYVQEVRRTEANFFHKWAKQFRKIRRKQLRKSLPLDH